MKKLILLLLTFGACAAVSVTAADDLKDNSLQIDNSRLEKKEGMKFGVQSEQIKDLFNEATQKKLQDIQHYQEEQLITERDQLFSAIQGPVKEAKEKQLFQSNSQAVSKLEISQREDGTTSWGDFLPGVFYIGLVVLLVGITAFISYKVATDWVS